MSRLTLLRALWDRALALGLCLVGAVVLAIGWKRVSDTPFPAEQLPYMISAGIGGLALLGLAATTWLSADLRDEWHALDAIDSRLERLEQGLAAASTAAAQPPRSEAPPPLPAQAVPAEPARRPRATRRTPA